MRASHMQHRRIVTGIECGGPRVGAENAYKMDRFYAFYTHFGRRGTPEEPENACD